MKQKNRELKVNAVVKALGGIKNLDSIDSCISRLRLTVYNEKIIDFDSLKSLGALGFYKSGKIVHLIFGGESDILRTELQDLRNK